MPESESEPEITSESQADATPAPSPEPSRPAVALIVGAGREPDPYLTDSDAQASWAAATALWHPALLVHWNRLPTVADVSESEQPQAGHFYLVAEGSFDRVPSGFRVQAADIGATILDGYAYRSDLVDELRRTIDAPGDPATPDEENLAEDFLALGAARWWLGELAVAMGQPDYTDLDKLTEETLAAARNWLDGDFSSSKNRLRAAFEVLTQSREKFYPVDAYLVDICLMDPATDPATLPALMESRVPTTLLAPALAVDNLARRDPDRMEAIRDAVRDGWLDVIGGTWSEAEESLLPWPSVLWQYRKGSETYRSHLDDRNVETWARRRFGLHSQGPQIAKRFGLRFGLPMGFDAGKFPLRSEVKRLWESPDGSTLECLYRPPIAADAAGEGVRLPWRIGLTMRDDHTATVPIVHWTTEWADWYKDLRRIAAYGSVLVRWITVNDYFHLTDRPFEGVRPLPDDYVAPYLDQAVASYDELRPISKRVEHARLRARLDAAETVRSFAACLTEGAVDPAEVLSSADAREDRLETGDWPKLEADLAVGLPHWGKALARAVLGEPGGESRSGYLVVNPLGQPRRATVLLPDAAPDLQPDGPLRAAQFTDEGVWAVVDLPAFGYAWVPKGNVGGGPTSTGEVSLDGNRLKNAFLEILVDPTTGGLRGVHGPNEPTARLGQQLVLLDRRPSQAGTPASRMVASKIDQDYAGPALAQITSTGRLLDADGRAIVHFEQRVRVWAGRPIAEIDVTLSQFDSDWFGRLAYADPWTNGVACRWAWPDKDAMIRRLDFQHPWDTVVERIETPDAIDVSTRRQRAAMLFGGLAHHKRQGGRMLDTLLVAGREVERRFKLGVVLDLEHPFQAASEWTSPAVVVPTEAGPPRNGPTGWLLSLDAKSVAVGAVRFTERSGDGRGWGVTATLLETAGRSTRVKVRCFRNPVWARQIDFQGDLLIDLTVEEDGFLVELTPHEIALVDVTLG